MYRVLVVDDEKIEREGIKFLLSREEGEFDISLLSPQSARTTRTA